MLILLTLDRPTLPTISSLYANDSILKPVNPINDVEAS